MSKVRTLIYIVAALIAQSASGKDLAEEGDMKCLALHAVAIYFFQKLDSDFVKYQWIMKTTAMQDTWDKRLVKKYVEKQGVKQETFDSAHERAGKNYMKNVLDPVIEKSDDSNVGAATMAKIKEDIDKCR